MEALFDMPPVQTTVQDAQQDALYDQAHAQQQHCHDDYLQVLLPTAAGEVVDGCLDAVFQCFGIWLFHNALLFSVFMIEREGKDIALPSLVCLCEVCHATPAHDAALSPSGYGGPIRDLRSLLGLRLRSGS